LGDAHADVARGLLERTRLLSAAKRLKIQVFEPR
jgi:hypothetical protein